MANFYFDNSCTSFPKAPNVASAVFDFINKSAVNINRSSYQIANEVSNRVLLLRESLDKFFNGYGCENVIFTKNITESLNVVIKGYIKPGDHIIISSMEHNAVVRPIVKLGDKGVTFDRIPCDKNGSIFIDKIEPLIKENTKAIILGVANNVIGTIFPIEEIGKIAKKHNIKFIVDTAQVAGVINLDMKKQNIDVLCFTGHKSLLGPSGIGGFLLTPEMAKDIDTFIEGGTGSMSDKETMPTFMPDKFEAGTLDMLGITGLYEGIKFINEIGFKKIREKEKELTKTFIDGIIKLEKNGKIEIIGNKDIETKVAVVSIVTKDIDIAKVTYLLDKNYGIAVRTGLHCAPSTHKTLGTFPIGTIRFSFGYFNEISDIEYGINALNEILR